jgi:alpha-glucoside transport system substrate-binding protein
MAESMAKLSSRAMALGLGALLLVAACTSGGNTTTGKSSTDVIQWVAWGGDELKAYREVLKPFESSTGIKVHLTTNRESTVAIANGIAAGTELPDVAPGPTDPIQLKSWVSKGALKPLESFLDMAAYTANTYPALTTPPAGAADGPYIGVVGGKHYLEMIKTQVKGLFWYNKKVFTGQPPKTFDELLAINPSQYGAQKLFCAAFESGGDSGWPASDQLHSIVLKQAGAQVYSDWIDGKQKWTSPEIKAAYQTFLKEVSPANLYGGANTALTTNFGKGGDPLFKTPPGCLFLEQATFIANFFTQNFPGTKAGTDFDFFGHPTLNAQFDGNVNGFYDNVSMYNDTPAARKLLQYLATAPAQQIWANAGGTLGAIKTLTYTDPIYKRAAEIAANAKALLPSAGDFMPSDMRKAYWQSLLNVTRDPSKLDSELAHNDQVAAAAYKSG